MEYLVIVALVLAFMLPIWAYVTSTQSETISELSLTYAKNAANQIADAANLVYSQGPPAKIKIKVYIPYGVTNATIVNSSIEFGVWSDPGVSKIYAFSTAELNGTLPVDQGYYWFEIEATGNIVQITQG
jgi:uncharacterized protein (UPF0333 family)